VLLGTVVGLRYYRANHKVTATLMAGEGAYGGGLRSAGRVNHGHAGPDIAVTPDGAYALATFNEGGAFSDNSGRLALVDLSTHTVLKRISLPKSVTVGSVATSPDGSLAYFRANGSGNVEVEVFDIQASRLPTVLQPAVVAPALSRSRRWF
jgi:DNA-binding beta-propeller fold protein YncE